MFALCLDWNYVGSGGGSLGALYVFSPTGSVAAPQYSKVYPHFDTVVTLLRNHDLHVSFEIMISTCFAHMLS